jgi:hypothetical protein
MTLTNDATEITPETSTSIPTLNAVISHEQGDRKGTTITADRFWHRDVAHLRAMLKDHDRVNWRFTRNSEAGPLWYVTGSAKRAETPLTDEEIAELVEAFAAAGYDVVVDLAGKDPRLVEHTAEGTPSLLGIARQRAVREPAPVREVDLSPEAIGTPVPAENDGDVGGFVGSRSTEVNEVAAIAVEARKDLAAVLARGDMFHKVTVRRSGNRMVVEVEHGETMAHDAGVVCMVMARYNCWTAGPYRTPRFNGVIVSKLGAELSAF